MRVRLRPRGHLLLSVCLALGASAAAGAQTPPTPTQTPAQPSAPAAELTEARKVEAAADAQARLAAGDAFLKKYPKSTLRMQVAGLVADKIGATTDPAQLIALADNYRTLFNQPGEADLLNADLLSAYIKANRLDDAFKLAATAADRLPDPIGALIELVNAGYTQLQQRNTQYVPQSTQYAARVIALIESDKKPGGVDDARWADYKTKQLPQLYRLHGVLLYTSGDPANAKTKLARAIELNPTDPQSYWIVGNVRDNEYQETANKYKAATGAAQDELLKQARAQMDQVIDDYAHVVALTEGNAQLQQLHDQAMQSLQSYYKYRHNNSLDGLQQLIDKYKQPPAAKP